MADDNIRIRYENGKKIVEVTSIGGDYSTTVMKAMEMASRTGATYHQSDVADRRLGSEMISGDLESARAYRNKAEELGRQLKENPRDEVLQRKQMNAEYSAEYWEDWASRHERMARGE